MSDVGGIARNDIFGRDWLCFSAIVRVLVLNEPKAQNTMLYAPLWISRVRPTKMYRATIIRIYCKGSYAGGNLRTASSQCS